MSLVIPVAHDFTCGWCWIGLSQVMRLKAEFGIEVEWRGYELWPHGLHPDPSPIELQAIPDKPRIPSRFQLALAAEGISMPKVSRPADPNTHHAHEAIEFAKQFGSQDELVRRIYLAYWANGLPIDRIETIRLLATGIIPDIHAMQTAIESRQFADSIIPFNVPAYQSGVYNVPTFWIGGERFAEQPYRILADAVRNALSVVSS